MDQLPQSANPQPVSSPPASSSANNILLLIVVAVFAALLASLGTYFVMSQQQKNESQTIQQLAQNQQTQTETVVSPTASTTQTTNTKTYTNTVDSYSVTVPNDWIVVTENRRENPTMKSTIFRSSDFFVEDNSENGPGNWGVNRGMELIIRVDHNPYITSYEELKEFNEKYRNDFAAKQEITIDGTKAMLLTGGKPVNGTTASVYFFDNGVTYQFDITSATNQDELFKQVVSSFKHSK